MENHQLDAKRVAPAPKYGPRLGLCKNRADTGIYQLGDFPLPKCVERSIFEALLRARTPHLPNGPILSMLTRHQSGTTTGGHRITCPADGCHNDVWISSSGKGSLFHCLQLISIDDKPYTLGYHYVACRDKDAQLTAYLRCRDLPLERKNLDLIDFSRILRRVVLSPDFSTDPLILKETNSYQKTPKVSRYFIHQDPYAPQNAKAVLPPTPPRLRRALGVFRKERQCNQNSTEGGGRQQRNPVEAEERNLEWEQLSDEIVEEGTIEKYPNSNDERAQEEIRRAEENFENLMRREDNEEDTGFARLARIRAANSIDAGEVESDDEDD